MPQPVYATGPQVKTDECQRIVTSLVTLQCMNANNCIGVELGDIRPAIMLQLSRMTGGNYATACAGYLDGIFNDYVSQFANAAPNGTPSKFPTPVAPNTNANGNQIQLSNPFATPAPDWATDMRERKLELQALHTETGTNNHQIQSAEFPATYADVSFTDRLENARNGYEPFKDARAYREMDIEDEETYLARIERSKPTKKCTEKTCNIDYVLNGGTNHNENPDEFTTCGNPVTLRSPTKTANTFDAWYTDQNYASDKKITKIEDKHCTTDGDTIKLYARWSIGQPTADPDGTSPETPDGTSPEAPENDGGSGGQGTFPIPRIEQEDSTVPPISLEGKNPDSNLCSFASDGANAVYANTPSKLEYVSKLINTDPNGKIQLDAAAYAGCATQTGIAGGTYCWCAFDGRECDKPEEVGCEENELVPKFMLICNDLAKELVNPTTSERCPEDCKQFCKDLLDPPQNQQ